MHYDTLMNAILLVVALHHNTLLHVVLVVVVVVVHHHTLLHVLVGMMHTHVAGILYIYNIVAMCLWWYAA
jgi:hypothetical protein